MSDADAQPTLPADLRLGPVHLTVTDLDRSVGFYQDAIGLRQHRREDPVAAMGAGREDLLVLHEDPQARRAGRHAGLYHVALLHPSREELARAAVRLAVTRTPIEGASDHQISEAIYLPDPDGNGLELAADRPRDTWPDLTEMFGPMPLDLQALIASLGDEEPRRHADPGLRIGHVHLHVGSVEDGLAFYRDTIGFDLKTLLPTAAFTSAGGYHHHVAFNTWRGNGVPPVPPDAVGMRHWTVVLPDEATVDEVRGRLADAGVETDDELLVRDPSGNALLLTTGA